MEFRNCDSRHVDWVKALKQVFQQLKAYVKQHHMAGPAWNAHGTPFKDFKLDSSGAAAPSPASASAPKPPPPGEKLCSSHDCCNGLHVSSVSLLSSLC